MQRARLRRRVQDALHGVRALVGELVGRLAVAITRGLIGAGLAEDDRGCARIHQRRLMQWGGAFFVGRLELRDVVEQQVLRSPSPRCPRCPSGTLPGREVAGF